MMVLKCSHLHHMARGRRIGGSQQRRDRSIFIAVDGDGKMVKDAADKSPVSPTKMADARRQIYVLNWI